MAIPRSFAEAIVRVSPPWLRRRVGGALMRSFGAAIDTFIEASADGVAVRFPGAVTGTSDALPYSGRDRRILRGPSEDEATFARRLRTWWDAHRRRGSTHVLLEQLYLFLVNTDPRIWDHVTRNGMRHRLDGATGEITRDVILEPESMSDRWARAVVFMLFDAYPAISEAQKATYTAMPRDWAAAHMEPVQTVAVWGGGVWDYPPGAHWDDDGDEYWDEGALVVNELYADGVPDDALVVNGEPMTTNSDYVTVTP